MTAQGQVPGRRFPRRLPLVQPGWLFAAPSLLIICIFIVLPIIQSIYYSFFNWRIGAATQEWVGLGNYQALLEDPRFHNALTVTLIFTVISVAVQLVLGFLIASALQTTTWLTKLVRSTFFFPTIVALATIGMVWRFLLDPQIGLVGGLFTTFGLPAPGWLQDPQLALPTIIFVNIWKNVGFTMIIILAGLQAIPPELYEAARIDGAHGWRLTRHVTLPSLRPTLLFALVILTINAFQVFDLVYVMTGGGPAFATDSLVNMIVREGFTNFKLGYASALSTVLFFIIMIMAVTQMTLLRYRDVD